MGGEAIIVKCEQDAQWANRCTTMASMNQSTIQKRGRTPTIDSALRLLSSEFKIKSNVVFSPADRICRKGSVHHQAVH